MFYRLEPVNRIILSAGHGGLTGEKYDPGATYQGHKENLEVKQIIQRLSPKLTASGLVVVTLPDYGLSKTIAYVNAHYDSVTDWAIEVHKDSSEQYSDSRMKRMCGVYYHPLSKDSKEIAQQMAAVFKKEGAHISSWSRPDTDSNHQRLGWIRQTKMLAHLIEVGFMQGKLNDGEDEFYAEAIARGITACLGIRMQV